ncbi:exosortase system-associated protein, TIGR04073 family [Methylomarinum sp. Ch1-1]|uniref:Exosortase system-associated protein, TIGR04073 family n=1 Tax=Methylomarinum roseum TaxID=3067653 RepID=A0AAU7NZ70_9GAMM|nr:exosortase system-associated protein, TIGR04073 family [Methylomarinum sp. Ch1-1]MDP4521592.1 exosortase system-associated protein, TIGR04073 family [Methylomarinum sp. Ch1-1]
MRKLPHVFLLCTLTISAYTPAIQADDNYTSQVAEKFTRGTANLFTGLGEVPKNIVNASEKTNAVVGSTGGLIMGTLDTLGRTASGIFDILSSPLPTESLIQPEYVWQDFKQPTSYGAAYID